MAVGTVVADVDVVVFVVAVVVIAVSAPRNAAISEFFAGNAGVAAAVDVSVAAAA